MMRRIGAGLLAVVLFLAVPGLPALAIVLLAAPDPAWPIWLCAAGGVGFLAVIMLAPTSEPRQSVDDDSEA